MERARTDEGRHVDVPVRTAVPGDAAELVRLRTVMFTAMWGDASPGPWQRTAEATLEKELADAGSALGAFVVDAPGGGLAACAVGTVERRLAAPIHPAGLFGYVFNVCTDERHRGRGYARAATQALLAWFAERGVTRVDLHATPDAERLYRDLGFTDHPIALSLTLPSPRTPPSG
jgi:ribosomal protein S18 acetylase RimI-like enzyme